MGKSDGSRKLRGKAIRAQAHANIVKAIPQIVADLKKEESNQKKRTYPKKRTYRVRKCLNTAALNTIGERLSQTELFEMWSTVSSYLHWSIGDPTEQTIISIRHSAPHLGDLIDFAKIGARLEKLPEFERSPFGVSLAKFFPEIVDVRNKVVEVIDRAGFEIKVTSTRLSQFWY